MASKVSDRGRNPFPLTKPLTGPHRLARHPFARRVDDADVVAGAEAVLGQERQGKLA